LIRARIVVEGEVQKVGYRDFVEKVARKLGVKGYVENLRDGNVQIVCEAEEAVLNGFVEGINVKDDFVKVEKVRVVERSEATGEFNFFEIKYGELADELGERLGTAVAYAGATRQDIKEMHKDVKGTRSDIKEMHADLKGSIVNMHTDLKGSIEGMHKDLKGEIVDMHKDLKDGFMGVRSEIRGMRGEMNERFDEMAKRYDAISAELVRTREELTRAVDGLLKLIEEFIRQRHGEKIK
jgi:acylphosphatase